MLACCECGSECERLEQGNEIVLMWAVFRTLTSTAMGASDMPLYRFDGARFTDEDIIKQLEDFRK